uniref:Uncharacterized protein n=1 Tax=Panagrolaimus superbus TaxID=310955 RepID=A0A914YP05_9BILA
MNNPNHQQFPTALVAPWEPEILNRVFNAEGTPMVEPGIIRIQGNEGLPCDRGDGAPSVPVGNQKVADLQKMCTLVKPDMSL